MPKAIVCIGSTDLENGEPRISYTVTVMGPPTYSYGSNYLVNTTASLANNLLAWRNKIINQASENGVILLASDVIVFGGPS